MKYHFYLVIMFIAIGLCPAAYGQDMATAPKAYVEAREKYKASLAANPIAVVDTANYGKAERDAFSKLLESYRKSNPTSEILTTKKDATLKMEQLEKAKDDYILKQKAAYAATTELDKTTKTIEANTALDTLIKRSLQIMLPGQNMTVVAGMPGVSSKDTTTSGKDCDCKPFEQMHTLVGWDWFLVLSPLLLLVVLLLVIIYSLRSFEFKDALSENNGSLITVKNEAYEVRSFEILMDKLRNAQNTGQSPPANTAVLANLLTVLPPTYQKTPVDSSSNPVYRPSISRFIALLSTVLTMIIVMAMSCLFIYRYIAWGCPPDFSSLSAVLIALGVGVLPYAVNKISTAVSGNNAAV